MKKKLEAELISIAHRILKLKNKSELDQLYLETQKLHEKLAVLKFVEENFAGVKPTIGRAEIDDILETAFEEKAPSEDVKAELKAEAEIAQEAQAETVAETVPEEDPKPGDQEEEKEEEKIQEPEQPEEEKLAPDATPIEKEADEVIAEAEETAQDEENIESEEAPVTEAGIDFVQPETVEEVAAAVPETKAEELFKPSFEWAFDKADDSSTGEQTQQKEDKSQPQSQIAFEDLLGAGYKDPVFVKPDEAQQETDIPAEDNRIEPKADVIPISHREDKVPVIKINTEGFGKGITVGLNDRIAFVKNLFNNSNEDYNRVLSQLITFNTLAEAQDFIENIIKPDYNNWEGKEEFEQRFMEVIEKKFS